MLYILVRVCESTSTVYIIEQEREEKPFKSWIYTSALYIVLQKAGSLIWARSIHYLVELPTPGMRMYASYVLVVVNQRRLDNKNN
jgi:hypothetical protein